MRIDIYTDGACSGNPGKGGYGIVMKVKDKNYEKRFSEGFRFTTNNRMELLAVIVALEKLNSPQEDVHIYTDSKYVADAVRKDWISSWIKKDFKKVKNSDLWGKFADLMNLHKIYFHWVKGHAGHTENEICDKLAVNAYKFGCLSIDKGFEELKKNCDM